MDRILSLLGLAQKAHKLIFGENILTDIKKCQYLFIACDASEKTKERYIKKCNYYHIPYTLAYNYTQISLSLGKTNVKVVAISDKGFKKLFLENK